MRRETVSISTTVTWSDYEVRPGSGGQSHNHIRTTLFWRRTYADPVAGEGWRALSIGANQSTAWLPIRIPFGTLMVLDDAVMFMGLAA